jgi:transposase
MPQNFIESRREQGFLLPPDVRDWVPADHLAWFLIDAVGGMDLEAFYGVYRADGHGRAAYEPSVMVALILYAFATGVRSSRAIERHCREHVVYRVITGNLLPDHVTIARFICRHEQALAGLFNEVLRLCAEAGLVDSGVVSVDSTRIAGNASRERNQEFGPIAREIVERVKVTDEAEDEEFGQARGDELPEELRTPEGRREFFRQVAKKLKGDEESPGGLGDQAEAASQAECEYEFDPERVVTRSAGRRSWLREANRQLERRRWENPDPVVRSREERLLLAVGRLEDDLGAERAGNEAYEAYRQQGRMRDGRRFGRPPDPYRPPVAPAGKVNITDPDSKLIPDGLWFVQGYNAQAAVNEQQIVLAAEITNSSTDFSQLDPMVTAVLAELERAGVPQRPEVVAADAGYWNEQHMDEIVANKHIPVLVAPDKGSRGTPRKTWTGGRSQWMRAVLNSEHGGQRYRKRSNTAPNTQPASHQPRHLGNGLSPKQKGTAGVVGGCHNFVSVGTIDRTRGPFGGLREGSKGIAQTVGGVPDWSRQTWGHHERSFPRPGQPGEIVQQAFRPCDGVRAARGAAVCGRPGRPRGCAATGRAKPPRVGRPAAQA